MAQAMMEGVAPQVNAGYITTEIGAGLAHEVPVDVPDGHTRIVWVRVVCTHSHHGRTPPLFH